jgi:excinuclease ABC subunit B
MAGAIDETSRRRERQQAYNEAHGITPESIRKNLPDLLASVYEKDHMTLDLEEDVPVYKGPRDKKKYLAKIEKDMQVAAQNLNFEEAARLRDHLKRIQKTDLL